jgi:hypothetical protein
MVISVLGIKKEGRIKKDYVPRFRVDMAVL